jgi:hypothetical protein
VHPAILITIFSSSVSPFAFTLNIARVFLLRRKFGRLISCNNSFWREGELKKVSRELSWGARRYQVDCQADGSEFIEFFLLLLGLSVRLSNQNKLTFALASFSICTREAHERADYTNEECFVRSARPERLISIQGD